MMLFGRWRASAEADPLSIRYRGAPARPVDSGPLGSAMPVRTPENDNLGILPDASAADTCGNEPSPLSNAVEPLRAPARRPEGFGTVERLLWRLRNPNSNVVASCKVEAESVGYALTVLWNDRTLTTDHFVALWEAAGKADWLRDSFLGRGWQILPDEPQEP